MTSRARNQTVELSQPSSGLSSPESYHALSHICQAIEKAGVAKDYSVYAMEQLRSFYVRKSATDNEVTETITAQTQMIDAIHGHVH